MREHRPSITACAVALVRSQLPRPQIPTGDAEAEKRLYEGLRQRWGGILFMRGRHSAVADRTVFIDDETVAALNAGINQVVIVGAGYDGRALRFRKPGVRFFEIDHPATQADKRGRMEALGVSLDHVQFVPINLVNERLEDVLSKTDHRREEPSLLICEGLVRYLPKDCVRQLFASMRPLAAPGSKLVLNSREYRAPVHRSVWRWLFSLLGEPIRSTFAIGEMAHLLGEAGWKVVREVRRPSDKTERILIAAEPL